MPRFPYSETDIMVLANDVKVGLTQHTDLYPAPPATVEEVTAAMAAVQAAMDQAVAIRAAAETITCEKAEKLAELVAILKKELRYAENTVDGDDAKLKFLGWGARKSPTPAVAPGQPRLLTAPKQGEGWLELRWLIPAEGGKATMYRVDRRLRSEGGWTQIASTYDRSITLADQPRGVELEYSVVASNKAGDGPVSNLVMVVL